MKDLVETDDAEFQFFDVLVEQGRTLAICLAERLLEPQAYRQLRAELTQIADDSDNDVLIDLRKLEFIAGAFLPRILECETSLKAKSLRLSLLCNDGLAEIFKIARVERLLSDVPPSAK